MCGTRGPPGDSESGGLAFSGLEILVATGKQVPIHGMHRCVCSCPTLGGNAINHLHFHLKSCLQSFFVHQRGSCGSMKFWLSFWEKLLDSCVCVCFKITKGKHRSQIKIKLSPRAILGVPLTYFSSLSLLDFFPFVSFIF